MDRTEIEKKLKDLEEKSRRDVQKSLQEGLITTKKDNFYLNRQIHLLQSLVETLKWESKRQDRKMRDYVDYLKSMIRDMDIRLQKFEQSDILEQSSQIVRRAS